MRIQIQVKKTCQCRYIHVIVQKMNRYQRWYKGLLERLELRFICQFGQFPCSWIRIRSQFGSGSRRTKSMWVRIPIHKTVENNAEYLLWRDLTKVISILNQRSQDWHVLARNRTWASPVGSEHSRKERGGEWDVKCELSSLWITCKYFSTVTIMGFSLGWLPC